MTKSDPRNASPNLTRIIVATVISNGFVAYDFTVYGFSAAIIGRLFFPAHDAASSLLLSLATFGAGFVMRPLGAVLIGRYADRRGREAGMTDEPAPPERQDESKVGELPDPKDVGEAG